MPERSSRDPFEGTPYEAVREIGAGSSGEVWEARHVKLAKPVVIKLLKAERSTSREQVDRLSLEARALARLRHPNVVGVTDSGHTPEGRAYVVMEHVDGHTLREELDERGPPPLRQAVERVAQILDGLAAAHEIGIVHRDVKPANVLVCAAAGDPPLGRLVKVLDFGLAKAAPHEGGPAPLEDPTAEGVSVGTPRYFSPEQARARPVDARTDVYATGLVLYELLYGRGPFDDLLGVQEVARAHAKIVPKLPRLHAAEPGATELRQVLRRALEKDPERRFESATAMASALRRVGAHLDEPPWSARPRQSTSPSDETTPHSGRAQFTAVLVATMLLTGTLSTALFELLR